LRREILIQQPQNLDTALATASRLEAYDKDPNDQRDSELGQPRGKNKYTRASKFDECAKLNVISDAESHMTKRMERMQSQLDAILSCW
jgi:hypothetical protein